MSKKISLQLGSLLRQLRTSRNKSQEEVARASDIAHNYYGEIERGRREPGRDTLLCIAQRGLNLPVSETNLLLVAAGYAPLAQTLTSQEMTRLYKLVEAYLHKMWPYPALLANQFWQILKWNSTLPSLLGLPLEQLPLRQRNFLRLVFDATLPCREAFLNWEDFACYQLALFQRETLGLCDEPEWEQLLAELEKTPDFSRLWAKTIPSRAELYLGRDWPIRLAVPLPTLDRLLHCRLVLTRFDQFSQLFALTFFPADEATEEAFSILAKARAK